LDNHVGKKRYFLNLRRWTNFDYRLRQLKTWLKKSVRKMLGIADSDIATGNLVYEIYDLLQRNHKLFIPRVANVEQTIDELLRSHRSMVRFGDGEFKFMFFGFSIGFQQYDERLAERLKEVLASNDNRIMIGILDIFGYLPPESAVWRDLAGKLRPHINTCLHSEQQYYDATVSRSFGLPDFFGKMKQIWDGRDVVIIEGAMTRMGVGNDLFDNTRSVRRILAPAENAFSAYPQILDETMRLEKDRLIVIALGPTATVLAYDLGIAGYHALDLGHLDICYELHLRGKTEMMPIEGKYVNEVSYRAPVVCKDEKYLRQILCSVDTNGTVTPGYGKTSDI
jgi:glycosyltransferase family protein